MSTGEAAAQPKQTDQFMELLSSMASGQMQQMEDEREIFHARMQDQNTQVSNSANRVVDRLNKRRQPPGPQYSPEITSIANILTQFPKLVPVVSAVIAKLMAEMDTAFNNAAAQYTQGITPPPTSGGTS